MKQKIYLFTWLLLSQVCMAQLSLTGLVVDGKTGMPLAGANATADKAKQSAKTNAAGAFTLGVSSAVGKLTVALSGYEAQTVEYKLPTEGHLMVYLHEKVTQIEEVALSTGYQKISKERATGSFSSISGKVLDQQVSPFILDKLVASANGLTMSSGTDSGQAHLVIRGLSTIRGPKAPLIILDNFPYDGDMKNINPNTIESITVLKDAAASSIWGARAANGVIVLTTKKSKFSEALSVQLNSSLSISQKPDLGRLPVMSSADFIDMEQELFRRGFYDADLTSYNHVVVSPVVDLLDQQRSGLITADEVKRQLNFLKGIDVRDQYKKYMYVPAVNRQYALNVTAGTEKMSWMAALGYDDNTGSLDESYKRLNITLKNTWMPIKNLTVNTGLLMTQTGTESGRYGYGSIIIKNNGLPYMRIADENGNALPVYKTYNYRYQQSLGGSKLLDWNYYPLTNWQHEKTKAQNSEWILNAGLNYRVIPSLNVELQYQYRQVNGKSNLLHDKDSFYARDYINQFTSMDDTGNVQYTVPQGGIYDTSESTGVTHNWRAQANFNKKWGFHELTALAGTEMRDIKTNYTEQRYYGYNAETMNFTTVDHNTWYPTMMGSWSAIPSGASLREYTTRYVSLFGNMAYTLNSKYTLSASIRRDASNLFGVKTNDQWNPFWSAGAAWEVSKEKFFPTNALSQLKLRGSYGFNGNIDPAMVAATTISIITTSPFTQGPIAQIFNYFNPNLRWETIKMVNIGLDFSTGDNVLSGTVEWYRKQGKQLFGYKPMDYTTGISDLLWNVAGMKGSGWDFNINSHNINRNFKWDTNFNLSTNHDKVTEYYLSTTYGRQFVISSVPISGIVGMPVYSVFAYRWAGLDPETGDPLGYLDGKISKDYAAITGIGTDVKDLDYFGSAIPTVFGNIRNSFRYRSWNLDVGLSYKLGYYFRRTSVNYTALYSEWAQHSDYSLRWQKPGDEAFTSVPSSTYETNSSRDEFYAGSSALIERGDHIRLQYINLGYTIPEEMMKQKGLRNAQVYVNMSNMGILWKATRANVDPDYNMGSFNLLPPLTLTIGFRANF